MDTVSMGGAPGTKKGLLPIHTTCLPASLAAAGNPQPLTAKNHKNKCTQMVLLQPVFLQVGHTSLCVQFPFILSFLNIQGVLVAHVNCPAQCHEPALPSNGGWIGHWCYI